jgi:hypothetical protein
MTFRDCRNHPIKLYIDAQTAITIVQRAWAYAIEHPASYDAHELTVDDCRQDDMVRILDEWQFEAIVAGLAQRRRS